MLREPASSPQFVPPPLIFEDDSPTENPRDDVDTMRDLLEPYLAIAFEGHISMTDLSVEDQAIILRGESELLVTFSGYLKRDSGQVYDALDQALKPLNRYALLRENPNNPTVPHIIHIIQGRLKKPRAGRIWLNVVLFVLTVLSVFFTGAQQAVIELGLLDPAISDASAFIMATMRELWRGYPYALSILAILIAHEMGHYLMMRRHKISGSLPYFIPAGLISPFGTFGAAIMLRDVLKNRKTLLDVGAAGPIAGFIVALPLVILGLSSSQIVPVTPGGVIEGNSLVYMFAKIVALGQMYPNAEFDVLINQVAFAGWTGLFLTMLNMIPLGQLDGGHVMYALFGDRARLAYYPVVIALIVISLFTGQMTWIFFLLILVFVGRVYAVPLDTISSLDQPRRVVAVIALAIFVLTFIPIPFYSLAVATEAGAGESMFNGSMMLVLAMLMIPRWWRIRNV